MITKNSKRLCQKIRLRLPIHGIRKSLAFRILHTFLNRKFIKITIHYIIWFHVCLIVVSIQCFINETVLSGKRIDVDEQIVLKVIWRDRGLSIKSVSLDSFSYIWLTCMEHIYLLVGKRNWTSICPSVITKRKEKA